MSYIVRKKVEMVEVTTYTHEKLEVKEMENRNDLVEYRYCDCKLERAWTNRSLFSTNFSVRGISAGHW